MVASIRTGFVGLGDMGGPIARNLIANFPTTLWARRPASLEPYAGTNFHIAPTLRALGQASDVVGVCVFSDADVRNVVMGEEGILSGMLPGSTLIVHSTITVETAIEIEAAAAQQGVGVLDAPVSGSRTRSAAGTLTIMVGGKPEIYEKALPVLRAYGETIEHMGPIGSGQKMKVLNNVLGVCNLRMAYLAIETGERMGLTPEAIMSVLRTSSGASSFLDTLIDRVLPDREGTGHMLRALQKDFGIFDKVRVKAGLMPSRLDELAEEALAILHRLSQPN